MPARKIQGAFSAIVFATMLADHQKELMAMMEDDVLAADRINHSRLKPVMGGKVRMR